MKTKIAMERPPQLFNPNLGGKITEMPFAETLPEAVQSSYKEAVAKITRIAGLRRSVEYARDQMIAQGVTPTEVWLGPRELAVFHEMIGEVTYLMAPEDRRAELMGLRVRESAEPGIFVGVSYGIQP